ncbi:hypothetical protein Tsubulata_010334 [Turnera subulata]|uniref:Protein kinase domain-containing protein n=1 Tax=Turnera subulata TaxID=218843 RepID=A0A9Q0JN24_9ROSI|nr:hypothetical protein Tsubulata_010334 [Turnera subulata]
MGCICSKGIRANGYIGANAKTKETSKATKRQVSSLRREEAALGVDAGGNEATVSLISNQPGNEHVEFTPLSSDEAGKKEKPGKANPPRMPRILSLPHGERGSQVVAGWPPWLTAVAGEAIDGWVPRRADSFEKLDKLEGIITSRVSGSLYLVFDYMEHDLAGLLATPGNKFTESQIKCYMLQLLRGLEHCHSRGILHRDIKGSNLLVDSNGTLKIGDFGLATLFNSPQKQPLTSRVVTLWYRPPELLLGATDYGVSVDLWSSGCILAELFAGKPIMPGRTEVEQLHKIFKLCGSPSEEYWKRSKLPHATIFKPQQPYKRCVAQTFKDFPASALNLLDVLLAVQPDDRGTASSAIDSEFFTTKPLPCDPSSLPKYPPSKEFDVKLRDERKRAGGGKGQGHELTRRSSKESKAFPAPDANAELQASIKKRQGQANPNSISEKYNPEEDGGSGFPIEPSKGINRKIHSHCDQSVNPSTLASATNMNVDGHDAPGRALVSPRGSSELRTQRSFLNRGASELSRFSNSVAVRGGAQFHGSGITSVNSHWPAEPYQVGYNNLHDSTHQLLGGPQFPQKEEHSSVSGSTTGYYGKKGPMNYSGPLIPPGGNIEEMLKEHEKQIQHAVRKARLNRASRASNELGQTESLLSHGRNDG